MNAIARLRPKKAWTDRRGISPVVATVLLVLITVALVFALFTLVNALVGDSPQDAPFILPSRKDNMIIFNVDRAVPFDQLSFTLAEDGVYHPLSSGATLSTASGSVTFRVSSNTALVNQDYFRYTGNGTLFLKWTDGESSRYIECDFGK